jgi:hypothetical protein
VVDTAVSKQGAARVWAVLLVGALPLGRVGALVVQTDEPGGKPPLHGSTNGGSAAPAIRVATALAISRIVNALKHASWHATSLRVIGGRWVQPMSTPTS